MNRRWAFAAIAGLIVVVLAYREHQADSRHQEARRFIEQFIPKLEEYKVLNGHYPERIPPDWHTGQSFPELVRRDFYLSFADGQKYVIRFQDPRDDPRFWFDDIIAYQSDIGHWSSWDGY